MTLLFIFFLNQTAYASRRVPNPYERCQKFLEKTIEHFGKSSLTPGSFPPGYFRFDAQTGAIPDEFFVEEALISSVPHLNVLQPDCHYAIAPWALPDAKGSRGNPHDIYCVCHGFLDHLNRNNQDITVTPDSIRSYFTASCQKGGVDPQKWQTTLAAFNPDILNISKLDFVQRGLINLANLVSPFTILIVQAMLALAGCIFVLKRGGEWRAHLWVGITAGAALWTGLQMFYLVVFRALVIEARLAHSSYALRVLLASQELMSFLLLPFLLFMIFRFRKIGRPIAPVVGLILAGMAGTIFTNVLTGLTGIWAFWSILHSEPKKN